MYLAQVDPASKPKSLTGRLACADPGLVSSDFRLIRSFLNAWESEPGLCRYSIVTASNSDCQTLSGTALFLRMVKRARPYRSFRPRFQQLRSAYSTTLL
jgi:hypothetical protein